jgi:Predicted metal-dependent phosphoesterases (PHP family)
MWVSLDYHIHSYYSHDSLNDPRKILQVAMNKGIKAISITDHNTLAGSILLKKYDKDFPHIIKVEGIELYTNYGDLIILGLRERLKIKNMLEVLDLAKSCDYVTILPHPYLRHNIKDEVFYEIIRKVDLIEAFNARAPYFLNFKAHRLAIKFNKPFTAGSDAHLLREIGNGVTFVYLRDFTKEDLIKSLKKGCCKGILLNKSNLLNRITTGIVQVGKFLQKSSL